MVLCLVIDLCDDYRLCLNYNDQVVLMQEVRCPMRRNLLALAALIVVISASWILISVDWQEYIGPRSSTILRNQILFVGSSSTTTNALRNSSVVGSMENNLTQPGPIQFT